MCLSRPTRDTSQGAITDWALGGCTYKNIQAQGDPLQQRTENDGISRWGYRNIGGTTLGTGMEIVDEIEAIAELGVDCQGYSEINKPWTAGNKWQFNEMMNIVFGESRSVYSSMPASYDTNYLPGGNFLSVNGDISGRIKEQGSDRWGRFCWFTIRGKRDEGILAITAYRVCHEKSDNPGPFTAYTQQRTAMREAGIDDPNPRKQLLTDLKKLIEEKRKEGFRPIVMMDANGDCNYAKQVDKDLATFITDANLVDEYHNRFPEQINTYVYGKKRLDYILVDPALVHAIVRIGYLGSHDGTFSDHVQAYVDFDSRKLFQGVINRPVTYHSREFRLEQLDKVVAFQNKLKEKMEEHNIKGRVIMLALAFQAHGKTQKNVDRYQVLDEEIKDLALSVAKMVARKKYGYMRDPNLTIAGRMLILLKMVLDCKMRRAPPTDALVRRAKSLDVDLDQYFVQSIKEVRKECCTARKDLWEAQKKCEEGRLEWLREEARKRALAGDKETEQIFKDMCRVAESRAVNRKLTQILKPRSGAIDRIEVPTHDWFYSRKSNELFHYDRGNFETHAHATDGLYYRHHVLKVPPDDIVQCSVDTSGDQIRLVEAYHWFYSPSKDTLFHRVGKEVQRFARSPDGCYVIRRSGLIPNDSVVARVYEEKLGRHVILETLPIPAQIWQEVNSPVDMEWMLLERNKRHLQQRDIEQGDSCGPIMQDLHKEHGLSAAAEDLLEGRYTTNHSISPEMNAWFKHMQRSTKEEESPEIVGSISKTEYQAAFKAANEKTSSSPAGLHYTIWKAMASQDYFAEFLCIMMSLPFLYGFVNKRWTREIDVMLEKKKGVRKIHLLRIIGLLEADFNTALKFFFSCRMQQASEANDSLSTEQFGSRKNRECINAIMTKLLTFECARCKRTTVAEQQHDCKGCFDRMTTSHSNIHARKQNVAEKLLLSRSMTVCQLERSVKTSLGVSEATYSQSQDEPRIDGEVQGKGDVPSLYCQQSSIMLKAHGELAPGVHMMNPDGSRNIAHKNVSYVDDNDGQVTAAHNSKAPIPEAVAKLQQSTDIWNKIVELGGQSLASHKEAWTLLAYEWIKGKMKLVKATKETIVLEDGKGSFSVISFKPSSEPNGGLGVKCCPDGNQRHNLKAIRASMASLCGACSSAYLTEKEAFQALFQRLVPKLDYQLHVTSFDKEESTSINSIIRRAMYPLMKFNRNFPDAVAYGPIEYGGMEFPEVHTRQDQLQIPYFLKSLRMNEELANDFLTTLDNIQLDSGFVRPILEDISLPLDFVGKGWIVGLRERMREYKGSIWVEDAWVPRLQRVNDTSIMAVLSQLYGITPGELIKINEVRKYLRVITLADLTSEDGTQINAGLLGGDWIAGTDLEWPNQEKPPLSWFRLFRKCINNAYGVGSSERLLVSKPIVLRVPLGTWHPVPRNTWWTTYKSQTSIYYRRDGGPILDEFRPDNSGFYRHVGTIEKVPEDSHPITAKKVGDKIWLHKPLALTENTINVPPPTGHVVTDTFDRFNGAVIKGGSDGSLYLREQVAAAAWLITHGGEEHVSACFLITDIDSISIYRAELEGVFRYLKHIEALDMPPAEVEQWCDNEQAVVRSQVPPCCPRQMIEPEADLVLAIHTLRSKLQHRVTCRHVHGHQLDGKGKKKVEKARKEYDMKLAEWEALSDDDSDAPPANRAVKTMFNPRPPKPESNIPDADITRSALEVQVNTECDRLCSETTAAMLDGGTVPNVPVLQPPYEGTKAMFRIGSRWVTKNYKSTIYRASKQEATREYCKGRFEWTDETFDLVHWESIRSVRSNLNLAGKRQTSKLMHGWLPVMHKRQYITGIKQCPGCPCIDETMEHLFQCPHHDMKITRKKNIDKLREVGKKKKIPRHIMEAICRVLEVTSKGGDNVDLPTHIEPVADAIKQQKTIGLHLLHRGYLATGWFDAIEKAGVSNPDRKMNVLQRLIWDYWSFPIWATRNSILHGPNSKYSITEDNNLSERILWYIENKQQVLARGDQFMATIDVTRLHKMRRETKRTWVRHLDKLRAAFDIEKATRSKGQNAITQYLVNVRGFYS